MSKKPFQAKQRTQKLNRLKDFLMTARTPMRQAEIARKLDLTPSNLSRMIAQLELPEPDGLGIVLDRTDDGLISLDKTRYLNQVTLNLHQAMAVFLAVRLLARYSDKPNPHAVSALKQLCIALQKTSPTIADHIALTSERLYRSINEEARGYVRALETLTQAWANHTRVLLIKRDDAQKHRRLFEPYFIEPSMIGYLTYVIGYDHHHHRISTYTIDRLTDVIPTNETYSVPEDFNPLDKLAGAWGVNWGDGQQIQEVALRFLPGRAAKRVRETNWHESQVIEDAPDGGCIFRIRVGSTQEMKPWIRQWGPDVIVLGPSELRREIADEMRRAGEAYI